MPMNPEAGQAWFRIAMMLTVVSAVLVFLTEPDSAERVMSVIILLIGLLFIGAIVILVRRKRP
jgi:preprotein translocase subunit Sss1